MNQFKLSRHEYSTTSGVPRTRTAEETYETAGALAGEMAIADFLEITGKDRLGIPVWCTIRPREKLGKVTAGAGTTALDARCAAMMGTVERFSATYCGGSMDIASYEEVGLTRAVDPEELILPRKPEIGEKLHWVPGQDILHDERVYIPANAIYHPYDPLGMANQLFRSDPNGLGAGSTPEEAIIHGIYEVIERDALSRAEKNQSLGRRLVPESGTPADKLMETFAAENIDVTMWILDDLYGIPTVAAVADDTITRDPFMIMMAASTHPNPDVAAACTLLKLARNRALQIFTKEIGIHAGRSAMVEKAGYERYKRINRLWFADAPEISCEEIPTTNHEATDEELTAAIAAVAPHTDRICIADLTRTALPVWRVVIPGFEVSYIDPSRVKKRRLS
ncbi:YcaO-like family protein [Methanogenium organophilum]|uniref:YcaO-like family protein n=1 Tax=Methanogenium organophilum TaxID=2199 RepID=A0A9X9S2G5_METOG|nr:YcaO-like family protein [Methanogenium organophilum]WAI00313.1 YcaO-like family protein [Methanogenium organophilum]